MAIRLRSPAQRPASSIAVPQLLSFGTVGGQDMNSRSKPVASVASIGIVMGIAIGSGALAQEPPPGPQISEADFRRSDRFLFGTAAADILNGDIAFQWIGKGDAFLYRSQRAD